MSSPLLTRPGAVAAGGVDQGVAAHYGEPIAEQRALVRGIGLTDLSHLGVVTVTGPDRLTWMNSLSTQQVADLAPGASTELLLLDPNGHVEHAAATIDDGETLWLITEATHAERLSAFLDSMRFMLRVEVRRAEDVAVLGTSADGPALRLRDGGSPLRWQDPWPAVAPGSSTYASATEHPGSARSAALWLVPREQLVDVVDDATGAGARLAGVLAWEALRVAAWRPRLAREVDDRALPHELDWLRTAVHLSKGCYRGQETVARVFNLGKPPRRLTFLHLDGSDHTTPEVGDPVLSGDREVGRVTSVARHHELGPIALALLKRSLDPEADLVVGTVAASQETIVAPEGVGTGRPDPIDRSGLRRRP
ncbi:YgfZ/GcvT domain-containing protein [Pseudactinotalea terrae]|uniref:CAF17-like 4Fe-4S cluster assembly/insertion protein YgfZ n=1 Tax=Pseudactinotalea terrae TaxID=1743262 RepID=UPI0012E17F47|nr:glycine cleavage T C-terminal barrel domain-containing protein [Pseudactinotalea terrae]